MNVTKELVLAKATELGLTLTEEQITKHITDGTLPEKKEQYAGTSEDELISKYSPRQLAEMVVETRREAKERRLTNQKLKEDAEKLTAEIEKLKEVSAQYPELEKNFRKIETQLKETKEAEKNRRAALLSKLPDDKKAAFDFLLNVDSVPSEKFDLTIEALTAQKASGMNVPPPAGDPPKVTLTPDQKAEASRMGLSEEAYAEVQAKRNKNKPQ